LLHVVVQSTYLLVLAMHCIVECSHLANKARTQYLRVFHLVDTLPDVVRVRRLVVHRDVDNKATPLRTLPQCHHCSHAVVVLQCW